jgi:hypothetical protein
MKVYRGIIEGFQGSWGSGIATIIISGKAIPCENAQTVRALHAAFGNTIGEGHTVNQRGFIGQDVIYVWDDMGLMLGGFAPSDDYTGELPEIGESIEV